MQIEVTNLNLSLIEADLQRLFTPFGEVNTVEIVRDKHNNRSKGRALIDMPVEKEAQNAIVHLNGSLLAGKTIAVSGTHSVEQPNRGWLA